MFKFNKNFIIFTIIIIFFLVGAFSSKIYQPTHKAEEIYIQALKDYNNENYTNAYYLFAKIKFSSPLKQMAIYRQAQCSQKLGDKNTETAKFKQFFQLYPYNRLSKKAKYQVAQNIILSDPTKAERYFKELEKNNSDANMQLAIDYYKAKILVIKNRKKALDSNEIQNIVSSFRNYLKEAPEGRLALDVISSWKKLNTESTQEDKAIIARAYTYNQEYKKSQDILNGIPNNLSWAIKSTNFIELHDNNNAEKIIKSSINTTTELYTDNDIDKAIEKYLSIFSKHTQEEKLNELINLSSNKYKASLINAKCSITSNANKYSCYSNLLHNYPKSTYAQKALFNLLTESIKARNYTQIKLVSTNYIENFKNSKETTYAKFWLAKAEMKLGHGENATKLLKEIINESPDSYWAYRAYMITNNYNEAILKSKYENKPVKFPYKTPTINSVLGSLVKVQDFDLIKEYTEDEFVKSWCEHQKGNYATSIILAKNAMEKIKDKPSKNDLRWRLIYPQNYYKQIKNNARLFNNDEALITALIKAESNFDSNAQSKVGAIGLMQLMPSTAHEVGKNLGIEFYSSDLVNPELNLKIGNIYYSNLVKQLHNDILAIGAYNGGIGSIKSWRTTTLYNDIDEFIEQIPYIETQSYIIKVFGNYWNYLRIYQ